MLKVLLTIDADIFPISKRWKEDRLVPDIRRDLYGETGHGAVGLGYQLKTFAEHGLKANFMVESLFSAVPEVATATLETVVRELLRGGHEIHLHPHTEWIPHLPGFPVPYRGHLLRDYPLDEQEFILRFARQQLCAAGAPPPIAFRAGGFAANRDTLIALENCGIRYDTSFNPCYGDTDRYLPRPLSFGHATRIGNVLELPVAVFTDRPFHLRPAQLCACSFAEMEHALREAERQGWEFFVIVSHSFEMLSRRWHPTKPPRIRQSVVRRFEHLCSFLGANRDRFPTAGFADLQLSTRHHPGPGVKGKLFYTGARMLAQALTRLKSR